MSLRGRLIILTVIALMVEGCLVWADTSFSLSRHINEKAQQKNMVLLPVIEFDPGKIGELDLSYLVPKKTGISMVDSGKSYYILQFKDNIRAEWQEFLIKQGVEIYWYIPNNGRLVGMSSNLEDKIKGLDFIRWIGRYQPAMKVQPELLDEIASGQIKPTSGSEISKELNIMLFKNEDLDSFVRGIQSSYPDFKIFLRHKGNRYSNVEVAISVQQAADFIVNVANTEGVYWIGNRKKLRLLNDTSIQVIQNGPGGGTPIWNNYGLMG